MWILYNPLSVYECNLFCWKEDMFQNITDKLRNKKITCALINGLLFFPGNANAYMYLPW